MLIVALVLAVIGLAALVTAVVTSNELVAWVCIAASVIGVILLIVDAIRDRRRARSVGAGEESESVMPAVGNTVDETYQNFDADYPGDSEPESETSGEAELAPEAAGDVQAHPIVDEPPAGAGPESEELLEEPEPTESTTESAVSTDAPVEVHYVTSDESDSTMQVRHVTDEDAGEVVDPVVEVSAKNASDSGARPHTD